LSAYSVYVTPPAWREIKNLQGHIRQRVRRAVDALGNDPRPLRSKRLRQPAQDWDLWRLRLDNWRIVYAVHEGDKRVGVLGVRKRPPYDYGDLAALLAQL